MTVRVRIAPSPTGDPHVGTAYMALFNMIFAHSKGGKFLLRIEDTDQSRSRDIYEDNIYKALRWMGLSWDEGPDVGGEYGPYRQSERLEIYQKYCQELLDKDKAYYCFATAEELQEMRLLKQKGSRVGYDRRYRNLSKEEVQERLDNKESYTIRLKVPLTGEVSFVDKIKGKITVPCADIDDQILMKSDGFPTYHMANVIDDYLMKITDVIRGDEWIASTAKHILLYDAFGWESPSFYHLPLLLGTDGKKLSKRKNPTSIFYYRDSGFLPEAFRNFLTLMCYSHPEDKELYSLEEVTGTFDEKRLGSSAAVFDTKKLEWLNQKYIMETVPEENLWDRICEWGFKEEWMRMLMPLCQTRIKTFAEFFELAGFFFIYHIPLTQEMLTPREVTPEQSATALQALIYGMDKSQNWAKEGIESAVKAVTTHYKIHLKKEMMPILYMAITGKKSGLPFYRCFELLGKDRARARLLNAIEVLGGLSKKALSNLEKEWDTIF